MSFKKHCIYLVICTALIVLNFLQCARVEPNMVCNSETYIGIFVTLMGIAVTLIIGYQIFNTVDVKSELRSMRKDIDIQRNNILNDLSKLKEIQSELAKDIDNVNASVKEGIAILDALRIGEDGSKIGKDFDAFCKLHEALLAGLDYDSPNYLFILNAMQNYGRKICTQSFGSSFSENSDGFYYGSPDSPYFNKKLADVLDEVILPHIRVIEAKIKAHPKFTSISIVYIDVMDKFYNRVKIASSRFFPANMMEAQNF